MITTTEELQATRLPQGIHAAIISNRHVETGEVLRRAVVWADRSGEPCETCGEPVRRTPDCPVTLTNLGDIQEFSQQHCNIGGMCGTWQPVIWQDCAPDEASVLATAEAVSAERDGAFAGRRGEIEAGLRDQLRQALALLSDDPAADVVTGSDVKPGVFYEDGELTAWAFDPRDLDGSETIAVTADDLA